jgi:hypothetical protein
MDVEDGGQSRPKLDQPGLTYLGQMGEYIRGLEYPERRNCLAQTLPTQVRLEWEPVELHLRVQTWRRTCSLNSRAVIERDEADH